MYCRRLLMCNLICHLFSNYINSLVNLLCVLPCINRHQVWQSHLLVRNLGVLCYIYRLCLHFVKWHLIILPKPVFPTRFSFLYSCSVITLLIFLWLPFLLVLANLCSCFSICALVGPLWSCSKPTPGPLEILWDWHITCGNNEVPSTGWFIFFQGQPNDICQTQLELLLQIFPFSVICFWLFHRYLAKTYLLVL